MDNGRRNLEEEYVMGELIRDGAEGPFVDDDIQEGPGPSMGDDIQEGDVTLSFLNDTDGLEGESEAGSEDEEVDRDDDYDERTEEGAIAMSGEVYILVYIACADE